MVPTALLVSAGGSVLSEDGRHVTLLSPTRALRVQRASQISNRWLPRPADPPITPHRRLRAVGLRTGGLRPRSRSIGRSCLRHARTVKGGACTRLTSSQLAGNIQRHRTCAQRRAVRISSHDASQQVFGFALSGVAPG